MLPQENNKKIPFYIQNFKLLVLVLFVVLLTPGYFLFIGPERSAYQRNKSFLAAQESEMEQKKSRLLELKKTLMSYDSIGETNIEKVKEILPYDPGQADLYINLSSLVEAAGVKLDNLSIDPGKDKTVALNDNMLLKDKKAATASGQIRSAEINLSVSEVNYAKVKKIFELIENNIRILDVKSFNFSPTDGLLTLSLNTYYIK